MNSRSKFLLLCALTMLLAGCATQKKSKSAMQDAVLSEALYQQTIAALESGKFRIDVLNVYIPSKPVKHEQGSYIKMDGNQAIIHFAQNTFPSHLRGDLHLEYDEAKIRRDGKKRNGSPLFYMETATRVVMPTYNFSIMVYPNSNRCFVKMSGSGCFCPVADFTGEIVPLKYADYQ